MISLKGPIALLFPGQGVQKPGMGKSLYDRYPAARRAFERAEVVLDMPIRRLCFEGPVEELNRTEVIQPCVMTVCWAAYEVWRESYGFENVQVTAGHSLGEIAALAAAGAIPWETALLLVKERGRIMAQAADEHTGGMIAIVGRAAGRAAAADAAPGGLGSHDGLDEGDGGAHGGRARPRPSAGQPGRQAHPGRRHVERRRALRGVRRHGQGLSARESRPRGQDS